MIASSAFDRTAAQGRLGSVGGFWGSSRDGFAEDQPVWLTTAEENPNGAAMLVLADGTTTGDVAAWGSAIEIFDGGDEAAVSAARERWKAYKAAGHTLTYWKQSDDGRWEKG